MNFKNYKERRVYDTDYILIDHKKKRVYMDFATQRKDPLKQIYEDLVKYKVSSV